MVGMVRKLASGKRMPTEEEIKNALIKHNGFQYKAAKWLGISASRLCEIIKKSAMLKEVQKEIQELILDEAEIALQDRIHQEKSDVALIFFLKTRGRNRGYVQETPLDTNLSAIKSFMDMQREEVPEL